MTPDALKQAIKQIQMDEIMQARVLRRSLDHRKELEPVKKKNYKRIAIVAVAAVMVLSITAFAAARNRVLVSWSNSESAIETLADAQQAMDSVGCDLTLPETFSNGYAFESGYAAQQMMAEEADTTTKDGHVISGEDGMVFTFTGSDGTAQESVTCDYRKGDETVMLQATKLAADFETAEDEDVVELEGHKFVYSENTVDAVAMVATEDGMTEVEDSAVEQTAQSTARNVTWQSGGMTYFLSQMDGTLTRAELIQMALELCA